MIPADARLLRIYLNSSERWNNRPAYQVVVETARRLNLAGASVFQAELCYGNERRLRDVQSDYEFADIAVVVEIVEAPEQVVRLLDELGDRIKDALICIEPARVVALKPETPPRPIP